MVCREGGRGGPPASFDPPTLRFIIATSPGAAALVAAGGIPVGKCEGVVGVEVAAGRLYHLWVVDASLTGARRAAR